MRWPQWVVLVSIVLSMALSFFGMGGGFDKAVQVEWSKRSFNTLLRSIALALLLYFGGFWK